MNKNEFLKSLKKRYEIIMGYFSLVDTIGHLSFGIKPKMKIIYEELDNLVKLTKGRIKGKIIILSDHGMKAVGRFGDHANYGYWSCNLKCKVKKPKLTRLFDILIKERGV